MSNPQRRVDWADRDGPEFVDVPYWRVAGSYATAGLVVGFVACLLLMGCKPALAGGSIEDDVQQQTALGPEQRASPNQPTIVVDKGGSWVSEWAALVTGIAALIAALGGLAYRRRQRHEPQGGQP